MPPCPPEFRARSGGPLLLPLLALGLALGFASVLPRPACAQSTNAFLCLTNAQQIRDLNPQTAAQNLPVHLVGVVTYYDSTLFNLFFQDDTAGIFVLVARDIQTNISVGQQIEVNGVCAQGDYAPIVKAAAIRVLGPGRLPAPRPVSIDQLFTGLEDSQWITLEGVARSTTFLEGRRYLNVALNGQRIMAYVENLDETESSKLINATVRLRGVCYSRYNMKRQLRVPWLAVSSLADISVEQVPPRQPQEISIATLAQFNSSGVYGNLVKISGVVTLREPDGTLFIQNHGYGLCVQVAQSTQLDPGDVVVVTGYSALGEYVPILEDASVKRIGQGKAVTPMSVDLQTLLKAPENFEGVLVRLNANLINYVESAGRQALVLQSSNSIFTGTITAETIDPRFQTLNVGSQIALTGVFTAHSPGKWIPGVAQSRESSETPIPYFPPESVQIHLRSFNDVAVIRQPPWWTLSRLLWTIAIMTSILFAGMVWVLVLGRRVRQQTRIIEEKIRRATVLEERNRIARELHDTLEQELAAITIQLDAVGAQLNGASDNVRHLLGLARTMSRRSLYEARRSVWDLRSHLLENSNLATALAELATPLTASSGIQITVESTGDVRKLPVVTEHNLVRITQEALANALKHSGANRIHVTLQYAPAQTRLTIQDDGRGFDPLTVGQATTGHFGLLDMRERAEKIGAQFSLVSRRGTGTQITLVISGPANHDPHPAAGSQLHSSA